jgi:glutamate--cysteine ligase
VSAVNNVGALVCSEWRLISLRLMKSYMPTVGTRGLDMMFRTCTIQVNLDFESEQDMIDKFRIGLALQPIAVAMFANSPFVEGKPSGQLSTRGTSAWLASQVVLCSAQSAAALFV